MPFSPFDIVVAFSFAGVFYKVGQDESRAGMIWAALSLLLTTIAIIPLKGGPGMVLLAQLALMLGIALYRLWRDPE